MGNCCTVAENRSQARKASSNAQVTYLGKNYKWERFPSDWMSLQQKIYAMDNSLRYKPWKLQGRGTQTADIATESDLRRYQSEVAVQRLTFTLIVDAPLITNSAIRNFRNAVGILLSDEEIPIGICVLLSNSCIATGDSVIARRENVGMCSVYFQTDCRIPCRKAGIFLHLEELEMVIIELETDPKVTPVWVKDERKNLTESFSSLYVISTQASKSDPRIRQFDDILSLGEEAWITVLKNGPEDAVGSPIFSKDGRCVAILVSYRNGLIRTAFFCDLLRNLRGNLPTLDDDDQNYVSEFLRSLNLPVSEFDSIPVVKRPKVHAGSPIRVGSFQYMSKSYCLERNGTRGTLLRYETEGYSIIAERINAEIREGVAVTATESGVAITGGRGNTGKSAYLWTVEGLQRLPDMRNVHCFHCVAAVGRRVFAVSGETNREVDCWNADINAWEAGIPLPERRSEAGIAVISDFLYLVGGLSDCGVVSDAVFRLRLTSSHWELLPIRLQSPLSRAGIRLFPQDEMLIFGGIDKNRQKTAVFYLLHVPSGEIRYKDALPEPAAFYGASLATENDFSAFAEGRKLFQFQEKKRKFVTLALATTETEEIW